MRRVEGKVQSGRPVGGIGRFDTRDGGKFWKKARGHQSNRRVTVLAGPEVHGDGCTESFTSVDIADHEASRFSSEDPEVTESLKVGARVLYIGREDGVEGADQRRKGFIRCAESMSAAAKEEYPNGHVRCKVRAIVNVGGNLRMEGTQASEEREVSGACHDSCDGECEKVLAVADRGASEL